MKAAKTNKRSFWIVAVIIVTIVITGVAFTVMRQQQSDDKCFAPNDALVSCEELKKNPTRTDWW